MPGMDHEPHRNDQQQEGRTTAVKRRVRVRMNQYRMNNTHIVLLEELLRIVVAVNINLGDRIEDRGVLTATLDTSLKPGKNQLEPVPLFNFGNELIDRESSLHAGKQALDRSLVAIDIQETTNNLRRPDGVDALNVYLDELGKTILVQIQDQVVDKVETVTNNDKRELVGKFGLLEEVLDLLGVIVIALPANALDFANLSGTSSSLNVLEVHFLILAEVDNRAKIVIQALEAFVALKQFNEFDRAKNVRVLGGDLDDNLEILTNVNTQHLVEASHGLVCCEPAEVVGKPLFGKRKP